MRLPTSRPGTLQRARDEPTPLNLLSLPLSIFTGGIVGAVVQQASSILIPMGFLKFDRLAEEEADWLGLQYLYKAGYDPGASVSFLEKLQARESARKKMSSVFSTHPPTESRVGEDERPYREVPRSARTVSGNDFGVRRR